jgi:hypothetical protein
LGVGPVLELPKQLAATRKKNFMVYNQNYHNCSTLAFPDINVDFFGKVTIVIRPFIPETEGELFLMSGTLFTLPHSTISQAKWLFSVTLSHLQPVRPKQIKI